MRKIREEVLLLVTTLYLVSPFEGHPLTNLHNLTCHYLFHISTGDCLFEF